MPQYIAEMDREINPVLVEREGETVQRPSKMEDMFKIEEPEDEFAIRINTMFNIATTWKR